MSKRQQGILRKLLLQRKGGSRLWLACTALFAGAVLLLLSVALWWNFKELVEGKQESDSLGSTFLVIGKRVTEEKMGKPQETVFTDAEITAISQAPQVQDVGALVSNRFPVYATFGGGMGFATELFLEAVPDRFMDKSPDNWAWRPGSPRVPIIISSDFLNLYNYGFALSQGLPQLSEKSIQAIAFDLKIGRGVQSETYLAQVVGFSDRISSVLVPESFIRYGNEQYAYLAQVPPSRIIVKAKDPSDQAFVNYLKEHDYTTNAEQLRWNRLRAVVDIITTATGLLAVLLMGIAALVFILFIELTIARAQNSIQLLKEIGYSPKYLSRFITRRFLPPMLFSLLPAIIIVVVVQLAAYYWAQTLKLQLSLLPQWPVWIVFAVLLVVCYLLTIHAVSRAIRKTA